MFVKQLCVLQFEFLKKPTPETCVGWYAGAVVIATKKAFCVSKKIAC
jgi:hypothetical protein